MTRTISVGLCGAVALAMGVCPTRVVGQEDLFGEAISQPGAAAEDIAGLEPTAAVDPAPADENPFSEGGVPQAAVPQALCRCVGGDTLSPSYVGILETLRGPLKETGLDFTDQPLEEVVGLLEPVLDVVGHEQDGDVAPPVLLLVDREGLAAVLDGLERLRDDVVAAQDEIVAA